MKILNSPKDFKLSDEISIKLKDIQKESDENLIVSYIGNKLDEKETTVLCIGIKNINSYDIIYYAYTEDSFFSKYAGSLNTIDDLLKFMHEINGIDSTEELIKIKKEFDNSCNKLRK